MTTAKPHQAASQSDSADDLIAELAKLMAQDAQTDRPAPAARTTPAPASPPPVTPQAATPAVRIPGVTTDPQPTPLEPVPRFDFKPAAPTEPRQEADVPDAPAEQPEPFRFDFDLHAGQRQAPAGPVVEVKDEPVETDPVEADPYDAIGDLISELHEEPVAAAPEPKEPAAWMPLEPVRVEPVQSDAPPPPGSGVEPDRFRVAPVFGLSNKPVQPQGAPVEPVFNPIESRVAPSPFVAPVAEPEPVAAKTVDTDPIDEIESLIGRAVRVELDNAAGRRSLATPTIPQPTRADASPSFSGVDEAILAAAAATGARVDWVNPGAAPAVAEPAPQARKRRERAPRERRPIVARAFIGPLVAVVLLLIAGFGLYWVLGLGRTDGPAPVLTADTAPVKETPTADPEAAQATQSVVFNEMEGVVPGAEEQLVSRDQADVNEVTQVDVPPVSDEGLANRKVRTVTVRPDGTIVSGDQTLAGSNILPVGRPNVPEVPGAERASPELMANAEANQLTPPASAAAAGATTPAAETAETTTPATPPVVPGSTVPVIDAAGNSVAGKIAPVPYQRPASVGNAPASGPTSPVNAVADPLAALIQQPAQQPAPAANPPQQEALAAPSAPAPAASSASNAPAYVQLASQRSEEEARTTANAMASRFGTLFGGANLEIQRVDLGERGIYYRVRLPAASLQSASEICAGVKANGGDCFTM